MAGQAGRILISTGSGTSGEGGNMILAAARSTKKTGGDLCCGTGEGTATSTGIISITSANTGVSGTCLQFGERADW